MIETRKSPTAGPFAMSMARSAPSVAPADCVCSSSCCDLPARNRLVRASWRSARLIAICLAIPTAANCATAQESPSAPVDLVLQRYRQLLLQGAPADDEIVAGRLAKLAPDGSWPDVDYQDRSRAAWKPREHLLHVQELLSAYYADDSRYGRSDEAMAAAKLALQHWADRRYQCPNWWFNRIGVPRAMRDIAVLLGDDLTGELRAGVLQVIAQYRVGGTGANLAWSAELALHHGCLTGDETQAARAATQLFNAITLGEPEGIQTDWSFFQHGPRLHTFGYGRSFVDVIVPVAWQLRGTPWELSADKRSVMSRFLLDGMQWMSRGPSVPPSTFDRQASRKGQLANGDVRDHLRLWAEVDAARRAGIKTYRARLEGAAAPLVGHRQFPLADFAAHHRPGGSFFLKTISDRTRRSESINGENLRGVPYLNSGDLYVICDGQEYDGAAPAWDWARLPGITTAQGGRSQRRLPFVGGVSDGSLGLVAMDYARDAADGEQAFSARKTWFFVDDAVVGLVSGWQTRGDGAAITTSLEQCRYRGEALVRDSDGGWKPFDADGGAAERAQAVLHHGVGYVSLTGELLKCRASVQEGSWAAINHRYLGEPPVALPMLQVVCRHESPPQPLGYAIILDADQAKLDAVFAEPPWRVLQNDRQCQAIHCPGRGTLAALFAPGRLDWDGTTLLAVDRPCLALIAGERLWLCDPTHQGGAVAATWQGVETTIELPPAGRPCSPLHASLPTDRR
ncbi:MAG: hypothetical protein CMJ58_13080 [Planctomycetaceae bacterium]|nr:hypothetical protein [Planctomycetaceae bacterium]